jgi:hypothetical protein
MDREKISRDAAKELIDEAEFGFIAVVDIEPKDTLGHVPPEDLEYEATAKTYRFGESKGSDPK